MIAIISEWILQMAHEPYNEAAGLSGLFIVFILEDVA